MTASRTPTPSHPTHSQILDCSEAQGNRHCDGGSHINAYKYIKSVVGLETFKSYPPSTNRTQDCHYDSTLVWVEPVVLRFRSLAALDYIPRLAMCETENWEFSSCM